MKRAFYFETAVLGAFFSLYCGNGSTSTKIASITGENNSSVYSAGAIAYIRNASEIRIIDSNGQNDRLIWSHPDARESLGLFDLAWRPDGNELAFSSSHEAVSSLYHADIYAIRPDGSGFRKITNAPHRKDFDKYKKGTITVTVRNNQYSFRQAQASAGVFFVNIIGADMPQQVTVPPGSSKTLVFNSVADFGDRAQALVAIYGNYRWFMPGTDVVAGKNVKAPDLLITGDGMEYFGAFRPVWKQDGSQISFRDGVCLVKTIPAHPSEGDLSYQPMFGGKNPMGTCEWDWGPTPAISDQVIYSENSSDEGSGIYLMKEGGTHDPATKLTLFADIQYQLIHDLQWLPDGSGFLYSTVNLFRDASNIFWYNTKAKQTKKVTQLQGEFARKFCISPDGKSVVYERGKTVDDDKEVDLWIVRTNGTGERLLVKNGLCPAWSR